MCDASRRISKLEPGAPLSIAMVMGDFDLSGIGTVTHVEGNRVYGFGHPMFSLGSCEMPMMTGYIHTVYPRASVSMKMGSPLEVVGVLDTDVSTGVAGRVGPKPDMLPLRVRVKTGRYADSHLYKVQMIREPALLSSLLMAVLTSAIDTEGNLPEELTAHLTASFKLEGHEPITVRDTFSGPRYTGPMGAAALFSPVAAIANMLVRNPMAPVRIEAIECDVEIEPGRKVAAIESVRLLSDTIEPGQDLKAFVTLKPFKGERQFVEIVVPIPTDFPEGTHEAFFCDLSGSIRRRFRNEPLLAEPRDLATFMSAIRMQTEPKRTSIFAHIAVSGAGSGRAGAGIAQSSRQRPRRVRLQEGDPRPADPVRLDGHRQHALGGGGFSVAAVHGGQGCRALVIVEVTGLWPELNVKRGEDDMQASARPRRRAFHGLVARMTATSLRRDFLGARAGAGEARDLAAGGLGRVLEVSPRARGDL